MIRQTYVTFAKLNCGIQVVTKHRFVLLVPQKYYQSKVLVMNILPCICL